MDKAKIIHCLEAMDAALASPAALYIYGSAALILLDEPGRTRLDIDVAGPYSRANQSEVRRVAEKIGCQSIRNRTICASILNGLARCASASRAPRLSPPRCRPNTSATSPCRL